jgi:predicted flap endonuclease-1-like 5' DNA nuclease
MRSDVTLYVVAAFFFVLTVTSALIFNDAERSLWIISTAVLGTLSAGLGYYQRPKPKSIQKMQVTPVASIPSMEQTAETVPVQAEAPIEQAPIIQTAPVEEEPQVIQTPVKEAVPIVETPAPMAPQEQAPTEKPSQETEVSPVEQQTVSVLTTVRGIGEKRASQLNSLGINSVEELAKASVEELAKRLNVSPKIVAKWVEAANQQ